MPADSKCPVSGKAAPKTEENSDSEEEKPRGGCPFMGGSDKKKNPNLGLNHQGYDEPFVSKYKYYLSSNKLDFSAIRKANPTSFNREIFDSYPIYLKHTLFFNGDDYKKVRGLQCCSRFMAYEELREKGNKYFNKGKYYLALDYYERAMSLFRWLEHREVPQTPNISQTLIESEQSLEEQSENNSQSGSKIQIELDKETEAEDPFNELKTKYKEFFITYHDDNVKQWNGEDMDETPDIDMRKSLLIQVYLNMAAAYINLNHFSLAEQVINDGLGLSEKVSQLYFRKAQALSLRKDCSLDNLRVAEECISRAITMKKDEKIFSTANTNILKMLNLHDAEEAYKGCAAFVANKITETKQLLNGIQSKVYERAKEIHQIEMRMIEEGKVPRESSSDKSIFESTEMKIMNRMLAKYVRVVEFYSEAKNSEQVELAKKEFQEVLRVNYEVKLHINTEIQEVEKELGDITSEKVQKRITEIKRRFCE